MNALDKEQGNPKDYDCFIGEKYNINDGLLCKYYDIEEFQVKTKYMDNNISFLSLNVQSLSNKWLDFKDFIEQLHTEMFEFSVIGIQEIWSLPVFQTNLSGYKPLICHLRSESKGRSSNIGGGVGFWIKDNLSYKHLTDISIFEEKNFESIFIQLYTDRNKFKIIGNVYRPPGLNVEDFTEKLNNILCSIKQHPEYKKATEIVLLGDFNINLLQHDKHNPTQKYLEHLISHGMIPLITLPTRITPTSKTLIDHIYTNSIQNSYDSGVIYSTISDHLATFHLRPLHSKITNTKAPMEFRNMSEKNMVAFKESLDDIDWTPVYDENPKVAFDEFYNIIDTKFEEHFPIIKHRKRKDLNPMNPYMTKGLLVSRKRKNKLAAKKIKSPTTENCKKFKDFSRIYRSLIRTSKFKYYKDKFDKYANDMKKTWNAIRDIIGKGGRTFIFPDTFFHEGHTYIGEKEISNGFNEFFCNIGSRLAQDINESHTDFTSFLDKPTDQTFNFANINSSIINDALSKLQNKNSTGIDKISTRMLKFIAESIMNPLVYLFNLSFKSGYVPSQMKIAKVIPIYKLDNLDSTETSKFNNYRPISLLSSFSKLLEKIVATQMFRYIDKFNILYNHQYGFRPNHDTSQPIIQLLDRIYNALNKSKPEYSLTIFLDLKKAFDCVDHTILLKKLENIGFRGITKSWFQSYLENRAQIVQFGKSQSSEGKIKCGVPQGSVLGPLLFLIYINDLPNATDLFSSLFADDTLFHYASSDIKNLCKEANNELSKASVWFRANKLSLNVSKTKYIIFRNKNMPVGDESILYIDGIPIDRIGNHQKKSKDKYFKFLGVKLDEHLDWSQQLDHVCSKLSYANFVLNKTKRFMPLSIRKLIYESIAKSHLNYNVLSWGNSDNKKISHLKKIQKKCIRNLVGTSYNAHADPIFHELGILKFDDLLHLQAQSFMYRYHNSMLPSSFNGMFIPLSNQNRTLSYKQPLITMKRLQKFPAYFLPKFWNSLPQNSKTKLSHRGFLKEIKNNALDNYSEFKCIRQKCISCRNK